MAKIITIISYDIISKKTKTKHINVENVFEIEEQLSYDGKPLTRIVMSNGSLIDVQETVENLIVQINN
ncbi:MAG TPA: hypothetical protein PKN32_10580 [Bacteroidales bacterium]|nr:hypothetical protein [Bacteroidales bacterium]